MAATALEGRERTVPRRALFGPGMILGLVLIGLFSFSALVLLLSYSDDLRPDDPPTGTVLDRSAIGFRGLHNLTSSLHVPVEIDPFPHRGGWNGRDIRIYFPSRNFSQTRLDRLDPNVPSLIVLPKWQVFVKDAENMRVARRRDPGLGSLPRRILSEFDETLDIFNARDIDLGLRLPDGRMAEGFKHLQFIGPRETSLTDESGHDDPVETEPDRGSLEEQMEDALNDLRFMRANALTDNAPDRLMGAPEGNVVYRIAGKSWLILAEPDLLNNQGLATESRARSAMAVLEMISTQFDVADPVFIFDDSLRRRETDQNLVKLLTRPPFLAATLCLLAAGALVGWQGFNRFGDPDHELAVRRGGATLARTAAAFITGAGRIDAVAPRYAEVVRRQVVEAMGLGLRDQRHIADIIARRETARDIKPTFEQIERNHALDPMERARRLAEWKQEILK